MKAPYPDGFTITPWKGGNTPGWDTPGWDYTSVIRLAASNARLAGLQGDVVADLAESKKRNQYCDLPCSFVFQPVTCEATEG